MRDAVALAYSGRIPEAREAALEQVFSDDPFVVGQGLEAFAVLGQQYEVRADEALESLLVRLAVEGGAVSRRAFDAAMSLQSRCLESLAAERLLNGEASWEVLRYAGELPSEELARALAAGWELIEERLRDEALLVSRLMPASPEEREEWGRRALSFVRDPSEEVRRSAFLALQVWLPEEAFEAAEAGLEDEASAVREAAGEVLRLLREKRGV